MPHKFRVGQRVQFTAHAIDAGLWTQRRAKPHGWKGTVVRLNGPLGVTVRRDGYMRDSAYHVAFWEPLTSRRLPRAADAEGGRTHG